MFKGSKPRLTLSFSPKEIFFSFTVIIFVSLIVFGIGFYIGSGFQNELFRDPEKNVGEALNEKAVAQPNLEEENKLPPQASQELQTQEDQEGAQASLPTELPSTLLSEKVDLKSSTMTDLFIDEKNLKTLSHVLKIGPFTLRLGTFAKVESALEEKTRVEKFGFPSVFFCPQEDSTSLSVCLGGFESKETAVKFATKLQTKNMIETYHIQKLN